MPGELAPLAPSRNEHRHPLPVGAEFLAELLEHPPLLAARKRKEHGDDDRKQTDREQRRPVHDTLAEEGNEEPRILRMPYQPVQAVGRQPVLAAGAVKLAPALNGSVARTKSLSTSVC